MSAHCATGCYAWFLILFYCTIPGKACPKIKSNSRTDELCLRTIPTTVVQIFWPPRSMRRKNYSSTMMTTNRTCNSTIILVVLSYSLPIKNTILSPQSVIVLCMLLLLPAVTLNARTGRPWQVCLARKLKLTAFQTCHLLNRLDISTKL